MVQCIIAAVIGGLEFCFPALFVDTFNTFEASERKLLSTLTTAPGVPTRPRTTSIPLRD